MRSCFCAVFFSFVCSKFLFLLCNNDTHTSRAKQPDSMLVYQRRWLQCKCKRHPYDDRHCQAITLMNAIYLRLWTKEWLSLVEKMLRHSRLKISLRKKNRKKLTIRHHIILARPRDVWTWISAGWALNSHWSALLHLQMTTRADVMDSRWNCEMGWKWRRRRSWN